MQINKVLLAVGLVGSLAGLPGQVAMAQATITQNVSATILQATTISLSSEAELTFEQTVSPGAERNVIASSASYTVKGGDRSFSIDTSGTDSVLVLAAGSPFENEGSQIPFTVTASADSGTTIDGTATFTVNGEITVAADQSPGDYQGDLVVTVAYE